MQKSPVAYRYTNWSTIVPSQKIEFNHNLKAARGKLIEAQVEEDAAEKDKERGVASGQPSKVVQEFVPVPLPSGALEPSPADSAYHQRSGNGNPCAVA